MIIKPTVGRVVLYNPGPNEQGLARNGNQPMVGLVATVWSDTCINIAGFDANGIPFNRTSVLLIQDGVPIPSGGMYAEWMPYQKGQAAKTEELEKKLTE